MTAPEFKRIEDRAVDEAVAAAGGRRARRGDRRRDAALRVLRPPRRRARGVRQARRLGDHVPRRPGTRGAAASGRSSSSKLRWRRQMSVEEFTYLRGRTTKPVKVTLRQRAAGGGVLRSGEIAAAPIATRDAYLADLVDFTRREIAELGRLGCEYVQIDAPQYAGAARRNHPRGLPPARQRSRPDARRVHRARQRDHRGPPGHHLRHPHLPRQPQEHVLRVGRLRSDRRAGLRAREVRSLPARVRRRAIGNVRAAAASSRTIGSSCSAS